MSLKQLDWFWLLEEDFSPPSVLKGSEALIIELLSWMTENLRSHYYHSALLVHNHRPFNVLRFHWDVCKRVTGQDKSMSIKPRSVASLVLFMDEGKY